MDDCRKYPGREVDTVDVREPKDRPSPLHCWPSASTTPVPRRSWCCPQWLQVMFVFATIVLSLFNSTYLYYGCCLKTNNIRHNFQPGKNMYSCDRLWESRRIHRKWGEIFSLGPKRFLHFTWFSQKLLDILTYRHNVFWHPVDILNNFSLITKLRID